MNYSLFISPYTLIKNLASSPWASSFFCKQSLGKADLQHIESEGISKWVYSVCLRLPCITPLLPQILIFLKSLISLRVGVAEPHGTITSIISVFCTLPITTMSAWFAKTCLSV